MLRKPLSILLLPFCFAIISARAHAQQIDPSWQILWPTGATGCAYSPAGNTCESVVLSTPGAAQTVTQPNVSAPLSVNYFSQAFSNGVVYADQFCGLGTVGGIATPACTVDACSKILAANQYAVANNVALVDASHFQGTQACSVNPYASISSGPQNSTVNLTDIFGVTHFQTTVEWLITNSGVVMRGQGPFQTQVEYTGGTQVPAVLVVNGNNGAAGFYAGAGIVGIEIDGIFFYGGSANAVDGVDLDFINRSKFMDVYTWGATTCGLRTNAAVTDTFIRPSTSSADASFLGIDSGAHTIPTGGLCLAGGSGNSGAVQTTDGTVIDSREEGLTTGTGWRLISANSMTFTSGTSESNQGGLSISSPSRYNTFVSSDIEGNTQNTAGVDIFDAGGYNTFINPIAASTCTSCASVSLGGVGHDYVLNGDYVTGVTGGSANGIVIPGYTATSATAGSATALPATPAGYINEVIGGANVKVPYYNP